MIKKSSAVGEFEIEGQAVNVASVENAISQIIAKLKQSESFLVFTLNLDHLVKLRLSPAFREAYRNAEFVTADGFPIVTLAGLDGISIERTAGSDLIEPLCRSAAEQGFPVLFLGTTLSALCAVGRELSTRIASLDIRGIFAPPIGFSVNSAIADEGIRVVAESGARICFVALGSPLQEIFASTAMQRTSGVAFVAVGAGLDFIAGTQKRSPLWLRQLNLEWLWRLSSDPARLGGRYIRCAILFAELLCRKMLARVAKVTG
jgi:N-acetylglucosaminyldiphosphoundecaprenol N-acetyl-beta-D-mannosaminyltransferase